MKTKTVTIQNLRGERERIKLPPAEFECEPSGEQDFTGVWITGLYVGPRTGRKIARTYSIWDAGNGGVVGERYFELDDDAYLHYCQKCRVEPVTAGAEI